VEQEAIQAALSEITAETDATLKSLRLASLCSAVFREAGVEVVVVGGSAIEFYTEGAYTSGDLDLCLISPGSLPLRRRQELMGQLQAEGGPRSWRVAGLFVDLLGQVESFARTQSRQLDGPYGIVEVFPPEVTQSIDRSGARIRGVKTYQYVLIPRSPGVRTIPPIEMSYFIPDGALYASSASQPLRLEVTGDAVVVAPAGRIGVETLREDIRFIRIGSPSLGVIGGSLVESSGFWVVVVLPLVAMLGSLALRQHWDRLEGDLGYARGRRAGRVAKKRLARANALLPGSDARSFYAEVERALRGFLADKLNVAEAGFMADAAEGELKRRGVSEEVVSEYLACLSVCDRARFAPPGSSAAEKSGFFGRVTEAMTTVQEQLS